MSHKPIDEPTPYDADQDEMGGDAERASTRDPDSGYDRGVWDEDAGYVDEGDD